MNRINDNYYRFSDNYKPVKFIKLSDGNFYYMYEVSFSNLTELYELLKSNPTLNKKIFVEESSQSNDIEFYGKPYEKALEDLVNLKENQYNEFMDIIKALGFTGIKNSYTYKKVKSPTGGYLRIPLYTAGHPLPYEVNKKIKSPDIITIHVSLGYKSETTKEQVLNRAIILISIVNALEARGHEVKISASELLYNTPSFPGEIVKISIDIKKYGKGINFTTLYKTLCPIEFLRRIIFRVIETIPVNHTRWNSNYGSVCNKEQVREILQLDDKTLYFGQPHELGIEGEDIEEDFQQCLESLNISDKISVKEITDDYKERIRKINRG